MPTDPLGDRIRQTVNGTTITYILDLNTNLTQVLSDGTDTYLYGLSRIGEESTTWDFFVGDALGSVRQLTGSKGDVSLAQTYQPFGEVLASYGIGASSYAFGGEWTDATGLQYLRARYLDMSVGRFISRDTWGGIFEDPLSLNRWMYTFGNPVNYTDPSGHVPYTPPEPPCSFENCPYSLIIYGTSNPNVKLTDTALDYIENMKGLTANGKRMVQLYKDYRNLGGHWINEPYDHNFTLMEFLAMSVHVEMSGKCIDDISWMIEEVIGTMTRHWASYYAEPANRIIGAFNTAGEMQSFRMRADNIGGGEWMNSKWNTILSGVQNAFPSHGEFGDDYQTPSSSLIGWANQSYYGGSFIHKGKKITIHDAETGSRNFLDEVTDTFYVYYRFGSPADETSLIILSYDQLLGWEKIATKERANQ